jgi:DNA-directed RNA polymerase specialized sigma24 family protein
LIKGRALYYHRHYRLVSFEDLHQEAWVIALEALERYDQSRSCFSTYLWHRLRALSKLCGREVKRERKKTSAIDYNSTASIPVPPSLAERNGMSPAGTRVLKELLERIGRPGRHPTTESIAKRLEGEGWKQSDVERGWEELKRRWQEENDVR